MRDVNLGQEHGAFKPYPSTPDSIHLSITAEVVEKVAGKLSGAVGPGGTDAMDLANMLLCYGSASEKLCNELAGLD